YDRLTVAGSADVDGSLDVRFLDGFIPARSNVFDILLAGSLTGSFDNPLRFGRLVPGGQRGGFRLSYDDNTVTLDNWLLVGDINGDGAVNNLDIAPFVALLTGGSTSLDASFAGDVNADHAVNNLDIAPFVALLTGGRPIPDNDPSFSPLMNLVPEPGTLALLAFATLPLRRRRRAG
ncbi:MAG TPA: dockerin type I domain-containing protein, partial [Tepidisphaeraceae bacterium]|nr:dockerin type I domain-containing protein [Tepidisphaeraceae bacterium]